MLRTGHRQADRFAAPVQCRPGRAQGLAMHHGDAVSLPCDVEVPENEQKNLLIFPMVEMKYPPPLLQNRGATPCHAQRPITPFVEGELARIWDIYGQIRREVEDQIRIAPSSAAYAAARGG